MNICVIGPGYVGLVTAACFAEMGNQVICVSRDEEKVKKLGNGIIPIYEPGLETLVEKNLKDGRLQFTTSLEEGVKKSLFVFIAVATPPDEDGSADLAHVLAVAQRIGRCIDDYRVIVNKSTVPVGTAEKVQAAIRSEIDRRGIDVEFDVISNPEFLKEGDAINDFMKPDRIVVGTDNVRTGELIKELYAPFAREREKLIVMDIRSAEMTKYAANAMLATKISFMNEMANICERVGADVTMVRKGIGSDQRIGYHFIYPGVGYGGSCFPKDVKALIATAKEAGYECKIMTTVEEVNAAQKKLLAQKIIDYFQDKDGLKGKTVAVLGLAFKPNTDDMREASSIEIINLLIREGARIQAHDPEALQEAKRIFGNNPNIAYFENHYDALKGADCMALITEWFVYRNPDFERMKQALKNPVIFDGRNQYNPKEMKRMGIEYFGIGRLS
ncbi:MAG: UDP-glucose/GDP-mannose dehydrogenase family protein [Desulfobacterales bacterium]|nr:MAG: UDP-glucose/GDP-mannose dehydrogenase family protein [Desulfobacterales bacterium]